jgi:cytochrome c
MSCTDKGNGTVRTYIYVLIAALAPAIAAAGAAEDFDRGYRLAQEKGCLDCHALGQTKVGPSFRAIAKRYRFNPQQPQRLPAVIRGGSAGHWGDRFVMWPQPRLSDAEVRELVDWVLSQ